MVLRINAVIRQNLPSKSKWRVLIIACNWDVKFSMYVLGTVGCQHIHPSWIQRWVLSVTCVQSENDSPKWSGPESRFERSTSAANILKTKATKPETQKKTFVPTSFKFFSTSQNPTKEIKLGSWRTLSTAPVPVWPLGNFFLRRRRTCRRWAATSASTSTRQRSRRDSIETFSGIVKMQPEAGFFRAGNELGQTLLPNLFWWGSKVELGLA